MPLFNYPLKNKKIVLALGPESAGNFSVYFSGKIFFSENFDDLLNETNYKNFQKSVLDFLKKHKIEPNIILTDLHPLYKTTVWGKQLSQKFKAKHIQVQHHIAHIFSAIGDRLLLTTDYQLPTNFIGIACDGTGYGLDEKIWGGEIFKISNFQFLISNKIQNPKSKIQNYDTKHKIERVGHLENQVLIGGDLAVKEPARMLIAILAKITNYKLQITNKLQIQNFKSKTNSKLEKNYIYKFVKKFYTRNQFELIYNQLQQNFNCLETSSTGRVLDTVSVLLGFCQNKRNYKHQPIDLLEKNSTAPYKIKPIIKKLQITNYKLQTNSKFNPAKYAGQNSKFILETTSLFKYLIKNLHRDKKRLAATAQFYIAQGLYEIIKKIQNPKFKIQNSYFAGGLANNKIISSYLESKGVIMNKKIPRGDGGLSFGQIIWYLLS